MTFFRALQGNPLFILFSLISIVYFFNGLRLAQTVWQRREEFAQNPLQPWKKAWSERAAFLLAIPPGVFVHELFHALAIWAFGGRVTDVGYGFYWGYVSTPDNFTAAQDWFISLAGTLGTLLYGFVLWLALRRSRSEAWRYFGLRALRFQIYFALLYYPLFTLFTFIGDWRVIYNFAATPVLSSATLIVHAGSLILFWWSDRRGWYEMPAFQSGAERQQLASLQAAAEREPADQEAQLQLIGALRRSGAANEARRRLRAFLQQHPRSAEGHLSMAFLEAEGSERLSRSAQGHVQEALRLGLNSAVENAGAHSLLGRHYLHIERYDDALRHLDEAIAHAGAGGPDNAPQLYYLRALVQRRRGSYAAAAQDIEEALRRATRLGNSQLVEMFKGEQQTIAHHRGQR